MPHNEIERLQAVDRFLNLQLNNEGELKEIVELASELCETPLSFITMMDEHTQYFKFKVGTDEVQNRRENTFCQYLVEGKELLVVQDALLDDRFINNPLVAGSPNLRFYAGAPLTTSDGFNLGTLCVIDVKPKQLSDAQKHLLSALSKRVIQIMEVSLNIQMVKEQFLQSEIKLRSFFESAGACHLLVGKELEVISFNKKMADFLERVYHIQLFAGTNICQVLTGKHLDSFIEEYSLAFNGTPVKYEREVSYDEELIWWQVSFEPCYSSEGEIIGISYNTIDITERKLHEQQIMAQTQSLEKIAFIQSHGLRRPVASILGFMELFKSNNYIATKKELIMMETVTKELDGHIRAIVDCTD
jgi:PAS domain S-box-containing protein